MIASVSRPTRSRGVREKAPISRPVRSVQGVLLTLLGVAGFCAAWNQIAHAFYAWRATPPGQMYLINGHRMHLYCTGAGSPTVVLEGGLGDTWIGWQRVQPALSSVTRVCSYDRAGLGFSDPQKAPRDARQISEQLHQVLKAAGVIRPLILVGQSAGGALCPTVHCQLS